MLAGITEGELAAGKPYVLSGTPTRFGQLDLNLEPLDQRRGWRLSFRRGEGPIPASVSVPATLGEKFNLAKPEGVKSEPSRDVVTLDPAARQWSLTWKS